MAEANDDNALFAIEVDVDDYAETAAADNPSSASPSAAPTNQNDSTTATNSRTYQSASAFQAQKAAYRAKIDSPREGLGSLEAELVNVVPALDPSRDPVAAAGEKVRLSKKESQLLGYAVGEMYFSRRFGELVGLCERVLMGCELDVRTRAGVEKWMRRSRERLGESEG
ncbi:hypothetical protein KC332_g16537 [Hortaea werneckii]|nr:hypothetical protein KC358_g16683 [Hortaea werneckii]KAI6798505.1 hypothetical protein KC350_g16326 [Hortaea werneckii]KAI6906741.1 hypothetical protein KC348_g14522 [Hortaea werneckii]KAI6923981.1 hypothetical protein KC341_g14335 [Hortaea werneckii]KAI6957314.1 hypothetical protein KC321_g14662 [Hortaea werneckii]